MNPDDLVRVRIEGGVETNVGRDFAESLSLTVLDEPVTNPDGTYRGDTAKGGRPLKTKTTVAEAAAGNKADPAADK